MAAPDPKDHVTKPVYFAAACTVCPWALRVDAAPTTSDRQRARDHARRHRHEVEVWERRVIRLIDVG